MPTPYGPYGPDAPYPCRPTTRDAGVWDGRSPRWTCAAGGPPALPIAHPYQVRKRRLASSRQLAGTRAGGFVMTRQEAAGKWGAATYSLVRTSKA